MRVRTEEAVPPSRSAALMQALTRNAPARIALGLGRIEALLARLGHPERKLPPVIHVAGTNGKGSVIAFLRAMLEADGFVVHSFTSPPLRTPADQIVCAGVPLDEERFAALLAALLAVNGDAPLTAFEAETAAALLAFSQTAADVALIETGLGGREDATNVVARPALTILTPIARDHAELLGDSLAAIAAHKAGIMKPHVPAIIGPQTEEASAVLLARARDIRAPAIRHGTEWLAYSENGRLIYQDEQGLLDLPMPALQGRHQIDNAGTAIAAVRALGGLGLDDAALARGLAAARWPARLQYLTEGPLVAALPAGSEVWLDGGHNPHAAVALAGFCEERARKAPMPLALLVGMRASKDAEGFFRAFVPLKPGLVTLTIPGDERAATAEALKVFARRAGLAADTASSLDHAAARLGGARTPVRLLVCGSLALAGAVLAHHA